MVSMGVLTFGSKSVLLGLELIGVVSRVGPNVRNMAVNDRVVGVAVEGRMQSSWIQLLSRFPATLASRRVLPWLPAIRQLSRR